MTRFFPRHDIKGSTAVETAIVGWMMCMTIFFIIEISLMAWMQAGLELASVMTARCAAIGATYGTGSCTSNATISGYAISLMNAWVMPAALTANNVILTSPTTCGSAPGNYYSVKLTSASFSFGIPPLSSNALSATGCFPMP